MFPPSFPIPLNNPPVFSRLSWIAAAGFSALAGWLAAQGATPVDRALPLIAVAVTVVAAASYSWIMAAVPLLVVAEAAFAGEPTRLLALGAIVAAAFAAALPALAPRAGEERGVERGLAVAAAAIVLLRWIPLQDVLAGREILLLGMALFLVVVLDGTPLAVAAAVATALATPAFPLRTFAIPLVVIVAAIALRVLGVPRISWSWPAAAALGVAMLFFPWSGVLARTPAYFLTRTRPAGIAHPVRVALPPGSSIALQVPEGAESLVVSGANVARMRRGTPLGRIEPGAAVIRVGDASDWGYARREQIAASKNPLPRDPAGMVRGYGYSAWVDGAGRVPLPRGARPIRVRADESLPPDATLQVEGFESRPR